MRSPIVVAKFGGSSVGDEHAMDRSASIALNHNSNVVLVSATFGTTDELLNIIRFAEKGEKEICEQILQQIRDKHLNICQKVADSEKVKEDLDLLLKELETLARGVMLLRSCSLKAKDEILSFGERMSSLLFASVVRNYGTEKQVVLVDMRDVMITDGQYGKANPQLELIAKKAAEHFVVREDRIYISQGFIGRSTEGFTTTLGRGGSDYSASLIAEAVDANILQIWTDVAGIATTDPRIYKNAQPIHEISYDEASEMAKYGAKILHPTTLVPAMRKNIPVFVGSSYEGNAKGTWIRREVQDKPLIRALAKRNDQALLTIRTPEMLNAVGFMNSIFRVFAQHQISVDCVTTSEISVAISIDRTMMEHEELIKDLETLGEVKFESGYALVSLIGNDILSTHGLARGTFNALKGINVRMMALGASAFNFNLLVHEKDSSIAIERLHKKFIGT